MFLWFKALHIVSVFAWMAGLLYLPRLFVYHTSAEVRGPVSEQFKIMERRLLLYIMTPAGLASWIFGALTVWSGNYFDSLPIWLSMKLCFVVALTLLHGRIAFHCRDFAIDVRGYSDRYFRVLNEIPTVLLFVVVVLATLKPF